MWGVREKESVPEGRVRGAGVDAQENHGALRHLQALFKADF